MKKPRRRFLFLERLEDRCVPATTRLLGSQLLISSPAVTAGATSVTITQSATALNTFTVTDGGKSNGTYAGVAAILYTGTNAADGVTLDLNGQRYTGSFLANTGTGNDTVTVLSGAGAGGAILGPVTVLTGAGDDVVNLNSTGATAVRFGGLIQATDGLGTNTLNFGNASAPTTAAGLTITGYSQVTLGAGQADVLGPVTVQDAAQTLAVNLTAADGLTINRGLTVTTGAGADSVTLGFIQVNGATQLNLGDGDDTLTVGPFGVFMSPPASLNGDLSITEGSGDDVLLMATALSVGGNLSIRFGDGDNQLIVDSLPGPQVAGNLTLVAGNGDSFLFFAGSVGGNITEHLGNGDNLVGFTSAPGGVLNYTSGNGADLVVLFGVTPDQVWNVNMTFGSNDDELDLVLSGFITGRVDGGGSVTGNVFSQDPGWTILSPFQLINFP
jgi:hypothetical protein